MTPMMQQYFDIKNQYKDYILFYRLGDFYEMFYDDALTASSELDLTLTGRDCGEDERAPMCGVPYHSCEGYIGKLIERGYKVAICEQVEDPKTAKNLVKREVIRIITPGTLIETDLLNDKVNNYLCTIYIGADVIGVSFCDISTAYICATAFAAEDGEDTLVTELSTYAPREILVNTSLTALPKVAAYCQERQNISLSEGAIRYFAEEDALAKTDAQFDPSVLDGVSRSARVAIGAALTYIAETQMTDISYIKNLHVYEASQFLEMDFATRRNLELCETMLTKDKKGSLLWVLDKTETAMGARMLKNRIEHPLTNAVQILARQQAVEALVGNFMLREEIRDLLSRVLDLERLITKVTYQTAGGRDLRAIAQTLGIIPQLRELLAEFHVPSGGELSSVYEDLDPLDDVYRMIDEAVVDNPPFVIREGGILKDGYNEDVDQLRYIMTNGKDWIRETEAAEREKTGIKGLKIGYNRVFGYYIEVTNSYKEQVPDRYIRKQTLTGCERYITQELKDMEAKILGAKDRRCFIEDRRIRILRGCGRAQRLCVPGGGRFGRYHHKGRPPSGSREVPKERDVRAERCEFKRIRAAYAHHRAEYGR